MNKNNKAWSTDVADACWNFLRDWDSSVSPETTWEEFGKIVCKKYDLVPEFEWVVSIGVSSWLWEKEFLLQKPVRGMMYLYGEHIANLFDNFGCPPHKVVVTSSFNTYDQVDPNQTVMCPICNADKIQSGKEYPLEWKVVSNEQWEQELKWSKNYIRDVRRSNFKYALKNPHIKLWQFRRWLNSFKQD